MSVICPHCEKPLSTHDPGPCRRKFTRRFFFGLMAGVVGAKVASLEAVTFPNITAGFYMPRALTREEILASIEQNEIYQTYKDIAVHTHGLSREEFKAIWPYADI